MTTVALSPLFNGWQGLTQAGLPLINGKINTYLAGTTTPAATYTDISGGTPNANPIPLDGSGRPPNEIWLPVGVGYKYVLTASDGSNPQSFDNLFGIPQDASQMAFIQAGSGAVARAAQSKMRERVSIFDFMTTAQITDYAGYTASLDHTSAFNAAATYANSASGSMEVCLPAGLLNLTAKITGSGPLRLTGVGQVGQGTTAAAGVNNGTVIKFNHTDKGFSWSGFGFYARDFTVYRPQPAPGGGWVPYASDYDFDLTTIDAELDDVLFWGSANGVRLNAGGRLTLNIRGQWFNNAVTIVSATDVVRIPNIHAWPFWSQNANVKTYMNANLTTLISKRADGVFVGDLFSIWQKRTVSLEHDASGDTTNFKASNIYSDSGGDGLVVETGTTGVSCQIDNFNHQSDVAVSGDGVALKGASAQVGIGRFISTLAYRNAIRNSDGTGNKLSIGSLYMTQWNAGGSGAGGSDLSGTGNETAIGTPNASIGTAYGGGTSPFTGATQHGGLWKRIAASGTTSGAGLISFAHGLGFAPQSADVFLEGSNGYKANVISRDATNVNCAVYNGTGTLNSTSVSGSMNTYY